MEAPVFYELRLTFLRQEQKKLKNKKSILSVFRVGSIVAVIAALYFLWNINLLYAAVATILFLIVFVRLVYRDLANRAAIEHLDRLIQINEHEVLALSGKYHQFDDGARFIPHDHYYSNDMDILGHASLYQFMNRTTSDPGAGKLAEWLLNPAQREEIITRQEAIKELKNKPEWRQNLQALGMKSHIKKTTLQKLSAWLLQPTIFSQFRPWQWLRYLLPLVILAISALTMFDVLSMNIFYSSLLVFAIIAFQINRLIAPLHEQLSKIVDELEILSESIAAVESQTFNSPLLQQLKDDLKEGNKKASKRILSLKKILDRLDIRYNIVISAPLNLFLLWNLQQALDLEKWKKQNSDNISVWFDTFATFEALNSMATIHFNNPDWCFPKLHEQHFFINATGLGHPLIPYSKRVNNFIDIKKSGEVMVVTGSNMAGKSTYLRSIGINVVLTMAGAPVCAQSFEVSPVQLMSSMRIADNLEESTSTFYAELKKLKTIIEKVNAGEKVFVLLDEILRGTNSLDRHTGSEALIKQLIKQNAAAVIATHDVALGELQNEFAQNISNHHFDVQVSGEELYFDYQLKPGVCTSMNASILMKKIGIEM